MKRPSENANAAQNMGWRPAGAESIIGFACPAEAGEIVVPNEWCGIAAGAVPTLSWQPLTSQVKNAFDVKRLGKQIEQMCPLDSVTRTHQGT